VKAIERALKSKPTSLFKRKAKHVLINLQTRFWSVDSSWKTISEVLVMNPNIFELAIREYSSTFGRSPNTFPAEMRPRRLTLGSSCRINEDFTEPLFSRVTHLTLLRSSDIYAERWDQWSCLAALSALTHLCLTANLSSLIVPQLLAECPRLRAVVTTWLGRTPPRVLLNAFSDMVTAPDARVVVTNVPYFYEGWEKGAWSGDDLWARVDDFIARKRRGEIEGMFFFLFRWIRY
jgi:hypothetical protein